MVVEDEPLEALDYCDRLRELGAEIAGPFCSVAEALEFMRSDTVDVALLDHALADSNSDGLQTALTGRGIPFVVLTGYPRVLGRRKGNQLVLSKPVSPELLCRTVEAAAKSTQAAPR